MSARFTEEDVGKTVVNANGDEIGMVAAVDDDVAHVEPNAGITDSIKAALGWTDPSDDAFVLEVSNVSEVTNEHVRLQGISGTETTSEARMDHGGTETDTRTGSPRTDEHDRHADKSTAGPGRIEAVHSDDDDDSLIGDDDESDLIGDDDNDSLIGDDDDSRIGEDDQSDLIGDDDDDSLIGDDDDDSLIGDDDDSRIGDDDDDKRR